jgi:phosphatidylserine/phosphatidylglycerophosphate/cardiolipin synthase-like enzyme
MWRGRTLTRVASSSAFVREISEHAERLLSGPVTRRELALGFSESSASSVEVLVEGRSFYPRMLEDIAAASSSIHINQFGFRPGIVGDAFADALIERAAKGVAVRLVVDRQGSDPERGSRVLYDRLAAADVEVCVMRATQLRAPMGPLGRGRRNALEPRSARSRRPSQGGCH